MSSDFNLGWCNIMDLPDTKTYGKQDMKIGILNFSWFESFPFVNVWTILPLLFLAIVSSPFIEVWNEACWMVTSKMCFTLGRLPVSHYIITSSWYRYPSPTEILNIFDMFFRDFCQVKKCLGDTVRTENVDVPNVAFGCILWLSLNS